MLFSVLALVVTVPAALSTPLSGRALPTPVSGATAREFLSERQFLTSHPFRS